MENTLHILILEDNSADAEIVQFELQDAGFSFTAKLVTTKKDFVYELQESCPDLILSDYDLPQFNGAEALKLARKYCPHVPFILVTGAVSEERAIEILTGGATDYVLKHRLARLVPAVKRALAEADEIKARQAAEKALKESERQVREQLEEIQSIYNSAPIGLCVLDRELRFVRVNQRLAEINGVPAAEHIGKKLQEIVYDLSTAAEEMAERIFQSGEPVLNVELTGTTSAQPGIRRTWRESWLPLKDGGGHIIGINVVVAEITEHKKLEAELRESYKTLEDHVEKRTAEVQALLNVAPVAIWIAHDPQCRQITGNTYADEIIMQTARGGNVSRSVPPGEASVSYKVMRNGRELEPDELPAQRAIATGKPVANTELELVFPDGRSVHLLEGAVPLFDAAGAVSGAVAVGSDITSVKQAEDTLRKNNRRTEILSTTASRLLASDNPQKLVFELCSEVMEFIDCHVFFNFLADESQGRLHLNAYAGIPEDAAREIEWLNYGVAVCGCAARDGCRIVAENIPETPDVRTELVKSYGVQAYACHPLLNQNRVMGTLSFGTRGRTTFSADDLALMKAVADQVAVAMTRIQTEKALQQSEELYRSLMELSPCASIINNDNRIEFMNNAALKLFGAESPQQVLGKSLFDFSHPDSHPVFAGRIRQLLDGHAVPLIEEKILRLDGTVRDVEVSAATIGNAEKAMIQVVLYDITERKQMEAELDAARDRLEARVQERTAELQRQAQLIDLAYDAIIVSDEQGKITFWSTGAEDTYGWTSREAVGSITHKLLRTEFPIPLAQIQKNVRNQGRWEGELGHTRKDGKQIVVLSRWAVRKDETGGPPEIMEINRDITVRKKVEEALHRANQYNRSLIEASLDPLVTIDAGGKITDVNAATERATGYSRGELINTDFSDYFTDPANARAGYRQVFKNGFVRDYALDIRHKNGHAMPVLYNASVYKDQADNVIGVFAAARDISERKRAEESERRASAYNRSLIEASLDPLVTIDAGGKITDVNAATEAVTGYSRNELIGTDFSTYFTETDKARAGYQQVFKERLVRDYALEIRHKNGHLTPVLYNAAVYSDETGQIIGVFAAARDITERKCAQDELQQLLTDQELIVKERTKELWTTNKSLQKEISERKLAEKKLKKQTSQLEAVNKELESFSYSVSHDLRAPLRAIDGFARMLLRDAQGKLDEEALHRLDVIRTNSGKMNQLIDDILAFSRLSSQAMDMNEIDMENLASVVWNELLVINEQRNIAVNISSLPAAYGDQKLVRQVLVNLLDNAVKYTKNKAQAAIEVGSLKEAGETVYYVRDNGIGFDMKHYDKLFGIFQRLHRDEEYEGTGVGLSIIKRIVQRHGGRVWAEGQVNSGAAFYFSLPGKGRKND